MLKFNFKKICQFRNAKINNNRKRRKQQQQQKKQEFLVVKFFPVTEKLDKTKIYIGIFFSHHLLG